MKTNATPWIAPSGGSRYFRLAGMALITLVLLPGTAFGINNDALSDLVFANMVGESQVCLQDGLIGFTCSEVVQARRTDGVALGDVDKDNNLDAVFAAREGKNLLCLGDGQGGFPGCIDVSQDVRMSRDVILADVDNDSNLDAIFANVGSPNQVCLGNGFVSLDDCRDISNSGGSVGVAVGDINNDGEADLVFANSNGPDSACLGDGTGSFSCRDINPGGLGSQGVALGFVNRDENLDAVFANRGDQTCLGDGTGNFTCIPVSLDPPNSLGVALGDVNGDGNLDAAFATRLGEHDLVCLGDGFGFFTDCIDFGPEGQPQQFSTDIVLSDMNADENLDAVVAGSLIDNNRICLGDGTGNFICSDLPSEGINSFGVAVSRFGPFCSSPARSLDDLRSEVERLETSILSVQRLEERLELIEDALNGEDLDTARERVDDFISLSINLSDPDQTAQINRISREEADSLGCGSSNLIANIPPVE